MKAIQAVQVSPFLPPELGGIREIAKQFAHTPSVEAAALFRLLDEDWWEKSGHDALSMLAGINQEALNQAAVNAGFVDDLKAIRERLSMGGTNSLEPRRVSQETIYKSEASDANRTVLSIVSVDTILSEGTQVGDDWRVRVRLDPGPYEPDDILAQIYFGRLDGNGEIVDGKYTQMTRSDNDDNGPLELFRGAVRLLKSGRFGLAIRVTSHHDDLTVCCD